METKEIMKALINMDVIELRRFQVLLDGEIERRRIEESSSGTKEAAIEKPEIVKPITKLKSKNISIKADPITETIITETKPIESTTGTMTSKEMKIIISHMSQEPLPINKIVQLSNLPYKIVHRTIQKLYKDGQIVREGFGRGTRFKVA